MLLLTYDPKVVNKPEESYTISLTSPYGSHAHIQAILDDMEDEVYACSYFKHIQLQIAKATGA